MYVSSKGSLRLLLFKETDLREYLLKSIILLCYLSINKYKPLDKTL